MARENSPPAPYCVQFWQSLILVVRGRGGGGRRVARVGRCGANLCSEARTKRTRESAKPDKSTQLARTCVPLQLPCIPRSPSLAPLQLHRSSLPALATGSGLPFRRALIPREEGLSAGCDFVGSNLMRCSLLYRVPQDRCTSTAGAHEIGEHHRSVATESSGTGVGRGFPCHGGDKLITTWSLTTGRASARLCCLFGTAGL